MVGAIAESFGSKRHVADARPKNRIECNLCAKHVEVVRADTTRQPIPSALTLAMAAPASGETRIGPRQQLLRIYSEA